MANLAAARRNDQHATRVNAQPLRRWERESLPAAGHTLALDQRMYRACIAVVDASRARLFTFERSAEVEGMKEQLIEQRDLVDPARRLRPSQLFSETRPGSSRTGGRQFAFDDHRETHIEGLDAEFARTIVDELEELRRTSQATRVIVCASPNMLGQLRRAAKTRFDAVPVDEIARDLVKLTPARLREHLASYGVLPAPPARRLARSGR